MKWSEFYKNCKRLINTSRLLSQWYLSPCLALPGMWQTNNNCHGMSTVKERRWTFEFYTEMKPEWPTWRCSPEYGLYSLHLEVVTLIALLRCGDAIYCSKLLCFCSSFLNSLSVKFSPALSVLPPLSFSLTFVDHQISHQVKTIIKRLGRAGNKFVFSHTSTVNVPSSAQ